MREGKQLDGVSELNQIKGLGMLSGVHHLCHVGHPLGKEGCVV